MCKYHPRHSAAAGVKPLPIAQQQRQHRPRFMKFEAFVFRPIPLRTSAPSPRNHPQPKIHFRSGSSRKRVPKSRRARWRERRGVLSGDGPSLPLLSPPAAGRLLVFGQYFIRSLHAKQLQAVAAFVWRGAIRRGRPWARPQIRGGMFVLFQSTLAAVPFFAASPLHILTLFVLPSGFRLSPAQEAEMRLALAHPPIPPLPLLCPAEFSLSFFPSYCCCCNTERLVPFGCFATFFFSCSENKCLHVCLRKGLKGNFRFPWKCNNCGRKNTFLVFLGRISSYTLGPNKYM